MMSSLRRTSRVLSLLISLAVLAATAHSQDVLTNDDVLKLHGVGLSTEVILSKIRSSPTDFDTSVDALVALHEAGLPSEVIAEMTGAAAPAPAPEVAPSAAAPPNAVSSTSQSLVVRQGATAAPNVASQFAGTPCPSPGIFVDGPDGLREIDPTTYTQGKSGGHILSRVTYGIKSVKSKAVIQGTTSNARVPAGEAAFYFCFEETETGLSYETKGATNPSEFLLVEFTVDHKKRQRWFVSGKLNAWAGAQSGAPPKALRETSYEKLAPGVYRVTPRGILAPGEYGFYYAGSAPMATYGFAGAGSGKKIFTFGIAG